jgi:hypothetical protein
MTTKSFSALHEGILRYHPENGWIIDVGARHVLLSDVLRTFENKDVRVTVVDLKEADYYLKSLKQEP